MERVIERTRHDPSEILVAPPPRISIVVLTHERPARLRRCLESLRAQHDAPAFEIVVADDGSGAETGAVVAELAAADRRIVHVRHEHRGIPATRNLGLRAARGELVGFVADDYVLPPDYLASATAFLDAHPAAAVVRFRIEPLDPHCGSRVSHFYYDASVRRRLLRESLPSGSRRALWRAAREQSARHERVVETRALEASGAAIFRGGVLDRLGGFDERLPRGEDTELTARLHALGHAVHLLPAPRVAHDYGRWPLDTLRKCWLTGRNREEAVRRIDAGSPLRAPSGKAQVVGAQLLELVGRGELALLIAALPWLVAFEAATLAGGWLPRRRTRGRPEERVEPEEITAAADGAARVSPRRGRRAA